MPKKYLVALIFAYFCSGCGFFMSAPSDQYRTLNSTQELKRVYPKLARECSTDKTLVTADTVMAVALFTLGGVLLIADQSSSDGEIRGLGDAIDDGLPQAVGVGSLLVSGIFGTSAYVRSTKIDRCQAYLNHLRSVQSKEFGISN